MLCIVPDGKRVKVMNNETALIQTPFKTIQHARHSDIKLKDTAHIRAREIVDILDSHDKGDILAIISVAESRVNFVKIENIKLLAIKEDMNWNQITFEPNSETVPLREHFVCPNLVFNAESYKNLIDKKNYFEKENTLYGIDIGKEHKTATKSLNNNRRKISVNKNHYRGTIYGQGKMRKENLIEAQKRTDRYVEKLRLNPPKIETYNTIQKNPEEVVDVYAKIRNMKPHKKSTDSKLTTRNINNKNVKVIAKQKYTNTTHKNTPRIIRDKQ